MKILVFAIGLVGLVGSAFAQKANFPADWKTWKSIKTPLASVGKIPACDADVSALPPIYKETVATYCGVKKGGPGEVEILVKPEVMGAYKARNGKLPDGTNLALYLKELKVLFVTAHQGGKPVYGAYTQDGKDITEASGPLSQQTCVKCHTGYQAFCVNGQCGKLTD